MTYATEFPDFDLQVAVPADWEDVSWHNDVCPSFQTPNGLRVWIDYADPAEREFDGYPRFVASRYTADMEYIEDVIATEDWSQLLAAVANYKG